MTVRPVPLVQGVSVAFARPMIVVDGRDARLIAKALDTIDLRDGFTPDEQDQLATLYQRLHEIATLAETRPTPVDETEAELLPRAGAAMVLQVTPARIGQLVRDGKLDGRKIGRSLFVLQSSVESLRAERERA